MFCSAALVFKITEIETALRASTTLVFQPYPSLRTKRAKETLQTKNSGTPTITKNVYMYKPRSIYENSSSTMIPESTQLLMLSDCFTCRIHGVESLSRKQHQLKQKLYQLEVSFFLKQSANVNFFNVRRQAASVGPRLCNCSNSVNYWIWSKEKKKFDFPTIKRDNW